ncbi:LytR/AlgR family response regulator transcription factor [Cyclobacterium qasimii]|nr:response regulator transcription factor [Cyclobacterium qasimii]EPR70194.1 putative transcriptional regulator [Cyclobacterium qasimii M12-11B]
MNKPSNKIKILLVEDDYALSENIREMLDLQGYDLVDVLDEAETAFPIIKETLPDLVLVDIILKGNKTGIDLSEEIRLKLDIPIVFLTSASGPEIAKKVKHLHPDGFITKPFTFNALITKIELALETYRNKSTVPKRSTSELFIRENGWLKKILIEDINWIKTEGTYIHILVNGKQYTLRSTVKELMKKLPEKQFLRIHKSFIINLKK